MLTLITAAVAAAQSVPATPQVQPAPMQHEQHQPAQQQNHAMKDGCPCCKDMGKGEHDRHSPSAQPPRTR